MSFINIDAHLFDFINKSETLAGIPFSEENVHIVENSDSTTLDVIDNETILEFLYCPETKIYLSNDSTPARMIAHNTISHEIIELKNISDHFIAMNQVINLALAKRKELKENPEAEILSKDLILMINRQLLKRRYDSEEVGIGNFRTVDLLGRPCNPIIATMEHGQLIPIKEWQPEKGGFIKTHDASGSVIETGRVETLIDCLLAWVNSKEFRETEPILRSAMFYTRFMHIHPFMDGNSRTDRMLLNYLLIISGQKPSNVAREEYEDFLQALTAAIVNKNYQPFMEVIKKHQISHSRELYSSVLKTNLLMGRNNNNLFANEIK